MYREEEKTNYSNRRLECPPKFRASQLYKKERNLAIYIHGVRTAAPKQQRAVK